MCISYLQGIFTLLSLVACFPLGELFFFHMLLVRKVVSQFPPSVLCIQRSCFFSWIVTFLLLALRQGITTYEYVVAMRAMSEVPQDEEEDERVNIVYSPT